MRLVGTTLGETDVEARFMDYCHSILYSTSDKLFRVLSLKAKRPLGCSSHPWKLFRSSEKNIFSRMGFCVCVCVCLSPKIEKQMTASMVNSNYSPVLVQQTTNTSFLVKDF